MVEAGDSQLVVADWATPGTPAYLEDCIRHAKKSAKWLEKSVVPFVETIDELRGLDWQAATSGPEKTWDRFCLDVLGFPAEYIDKLCQGVHVLKGDGHTGDVTEKQALNASQRLAADPEVRPAAAQGRPRKDDDGKVADRHFVPANKASSESAERIVRRLKRDHPDIAERLANGEFRSARAAGIAAGFVKVPTHLEKAQRAYARLSDAEQQAFRAWQDEQ